MAEQSPIGLIAGGGMLPILCARGIRAAGRKVVCVGLSGQFAQELPGLCDAFARSGVVRLSRWIRLLRRWGAVEAILVGKVRKERMYDRLLWFRHWPDLRAIRVWYGVTRHDRRSDALLRAVADELDRCGVRLIDSTRYIPEHLADAGVMTRTQPASGQLADIAFGLPLALHMSRLDIGQSLAVKDREVIAVEALEGTDAMIRRAGELCRRGRWVLIKVARPQQDMRLDVPTVGEHTIQMLKEHGGSCLAVQARRTILLDKPRFLEAADRAGVAVVGVEPANSQTEHA